MRRKGYTLVELLAVVVVLAIVTLISIPIISGVLEKTRATSAKNSAYSVLEAGSLFNAEELPVIKEDIIFECKNNGCTSDLGSLEIKGKKPTSGKVILDKNGTSSAEFLVINDYCFRGKREDLKEAKNCEELDETAPEVIISQPKSRKKSLVVLYEIEENESSIKKVICKYGKEKGKYTKEVEGTETSCELTGLEENQTYYYEVVATNYKGLEGKDDSQGKTGSVGVDIDVFKGDEYTRSKKATIEFKAPYITNPSFYIKTTVNTKGNVEGNACGEGNKPGECEKTKTLNYEAGKWYKVSEELEIIFNENGILYTSINDGEEYEISKVLDIDYIDSEGPTKPTKGSIGEVSGSNKTGTIKIEASGSEDAGIGGIIYKYLVTNNNEEPSNDDTRFTTSKNFTRSCGTSYYGWAVAEDAVGNRSEVLSLGSTSDGADSYSNWTVCNNKCGSGKQTRTNTCALVTSGLEQSCTTGTTTSYGGWSVCSNVCGGTGSQSRTVTVKSNYDGSVCSTSSQSQNCSVGTTTSYGGWSACSSACTGGSQSRTVTVRSNYDNRVCSSSSQSQSCGSNCAGPKYYKPSDTYGADESSLVISYGASSFEAAGGSIYNSPVVKYILNEYGTITSRELCGYVKCNSTASGAIKIRRESSNGNICIYGSAGCTKGTTMYVKYVCVPGGYTSIQSNRNELKATLGLSCSTVSNYNSSGYKAYFCPGSGTPNVLLLEDGAVELETARDSEWGCILRGPYDYSGHPYYGAYCH